MFPVRTMHVFSQFPITLTFWSQRQRDRKDNRRAKTKRKFGGEVRDALILRGKSMLFLEGSQAVSTRPSDNVRVKVKTAWDRDSGTSTFMNDEIINWGVKWFNGLYSKIGNSDCFKIGRAAWEACSSNFELGNHLSICLKTEENQENLCRDGRSRDLPDAYWLLASSPADERI
jgi:hypothetical protein